MWRSRPQMSLFPLQPYKASSASLLTDNRRSRGIANSRMWTELAMFVMLFTNGWNKHLCRAAVENIQLWKKGVRVYLHISSQHRQLWFITLVMAMRMMRIRQTMMMATMKEGKRLKPFWALAPAPRSDWRWKVFEVSGSSGDSSSCSRSSLIGAESITDV